MPRIEEMFAFIAEDQGPDDEGVVAAMIGGDWMPLVGADMARIESLRPLAVIAGRNAGRKVKLIAFVQRQEIETIYEPAKQKQEE